VVRGSLRPGRRCLEVANAVLSRDTVLSRCSLAIRMGSWTTASGCSGPSRQSSAATMVCAGAPKVRDRRSDG